MSVILSFPGGRQKEVLLASVPRAGDFIQLNTDDDNDPILEVDSVTWMESEKRRAPDPTVLVNVHSHEPEPKRRGR